MDDLNELGKQLKQTDKKAKYAVVSKSPEYGIGEIARDIFDPEVSYTMKFKTARTGMRVTASISFELPPPDAGLGNCCGDCYCAVCDYYPFGTFTTQVLLLSRPYVAGSIRMFLSDFKYSGFTETDPAAGIVTIGAYAYSAGFDITICYVYQYGVNCTTNAPPGYAWVLFDDFNRVQGPVSAIDNDFGYSLNPVMRWFATDTEWSIVSGSAYVEGTLNNGQQIQNPYVYDPAYLSPVMPWQDGTWAVKIKTKFAWTNAENQGGRTIGFNPNGGGVSDWLDIYPTDIVDIDGPWGYFRLRHYSDNLYTPMIFTENVWYWIILERTISTNLLRVKIWLDGDTEPEAWTASLATTSTTPSTFYFIFDGALSAGDEWWIDEIYFADPSE